MKKNKPLRFLPLLLALVLLITGGIWKIRADKINFQDVKDLTNGLQNVVEGLISGEPAEVVRLREETVTAADDESCEYYFLQLGEEEQKAYRQMQQGIVDREDSFYLTISGEDSLDKVYHALLKDHPEYYWIHNKEQFYRTTYGDSEYCTFTPAYLYTEEEEQEIDAAIEEAYQTVKSRITEEESVYDIISTVYSYIIDSADYVESDDDQSIAGIFWKKSAVCAGYAGALQYLLNRLGIFCIYVEGQAAGSAEGHAWNIVEIDGEYYYVDVTNADQPQFFEGDAVSMEEHKTIMYDYLCPFPWEYEANYTASSEFTIPQCTSTAMNFYVLNDACFDAYNAETIYQFCQMRINNNAAVIRFKFSNQDAYDAACADLIDGEGTKAIAQYYMQAHGLDSIEYHYGVLEDFRTLYYMF